MTNLKKIVDRVELLDKFAAEVADGKYRKMPYVTWRKIAHMNNIPYIGISYMIDGHYFKVYTIDFAGMAKETIEKFDICDHSLGEYLSIHWEEIAPVGGSMNYISTAGNVNNNYDQSQTSGYTTISSTEYPCYYNTPVNPVFSTIDDVRKICEQVIDEKNTKKENKTMNTNDLFHFEFGPVSSNQFRMSPYGLAVRTDKNGWISYNAKTGEIMDVEVINFDISKMIYKMPVAMNAVSVGDIVIHGGKPVFVRINAGNGTINVIDYATASVMDILPVKSPFGFNFFTKVMPLFDMSGVNANADNPFGNMLPFMLMSGEKDGDFDPTLLFLAGGMSNLDFSKNPMLMYFLMNRKDKNDLLPFVLMMNGGVFNGMNTSIQPATPAVATANT